VLALGIKATTAIREVAINPSNVAETTTSPNCNPSARNITAGPKEVLSEATDEAEMVQVGLTSIDPPEEFPLAVNVNEPFFTTTAAGGEIENENVEAANLSLFLQPKKTRKLIIPNIGIMTASGFLFKRFNRTFK
jgi:hypothetical protein